LQQVFKAERSKESKKVESVEEEPSDLPFWSHKGLQHNGIWMPSLTEGFLKLWQIKKNRISK
jgi:hypothetical protein